MFEKTDGCRLVKPLEWFIYLLAITFSLFHIYISGFGLMSMGAARHIHLIISMSLIFLIYPLSKQSPRHWTFIVDLLLVTLAVVVGVYLEVEFEALEWRAGDPNTTDFVLGVIACLLTLEISRRTIGLSLPVTSLLFIAYALWGNYIPGYFGHRGFDLYQQIYSYYIELRGIYGASLGIVVEVVVLFIMFGSFLQVTGAGDFFVELAYAVTGSMRGGPAKTAVLASALMGTISGSSTANVVATGSVTIPLMKRVGFPPHIAAAVETAASLGGQLMPPVMGAAAFLMVAITGIPYNEIIKAAAIPACMYFASVYASVHFIACKMNIQGIPIHGSYWRKLLTTLKKGLPFILPVTLLFTLLLMGYSAHYSALISIASLVVVGCLKREKRLGLRSILKALEMGAKSSLIVSAACACVGFGVGVVGLTGVGVKFSSFIVSGSGGSIFLTVLLVGIAALIVGIELPIAAAYLVLAVLAAPALQAIGLPVMVSHLIIMWFSIDAAVTPPVAITAFVAAGIAGAGPFKTSFSAWNMAKGIYLIPFMMVYTPITLNGPLWEILFATMAGTIGLVAAAAGMHGWLIYRTSWFHRSLLILIAAGTITPWLIPRIIGIVVFAVLAAYQWLHRPSHKEMTIVEPTIVDVDLRIKEVKLAIDVRKIEID